MEGIIMMKKKLLTGIFVGTLACLLLAGCGKSGGGSQGSGGKSGKTELVIWSSYSTQANSKLGELAAKFNAENDKYEVKMEPGLNETQTSQKLATMNKKDYPAIFMGTDRKIFAYAKADYVKPIQEFLDNETDGYLDDMLPYVREAYSDLDGRLIGIPVGCSIKGYMVNLDILAQTGYTVDDIVNLETMVAAAREAKTKGYAKYGYIPAGNSEILNMLVYQGVDLFDNNNGYDGEITKTMLTEGKTKEAVDKILKIYAEMYADGTFLNNASGSEKFMSEFTSGNALFWYVTSSYVYEYSNVNVKFNWAFIPLGGIDDNAKYKNTAIPEGTGMFIANSGDEDKMQGAYEFMKFMSRPENQNFWCTYRGYTPYTEEALSSQEWITWRDEVFPSEVRLEEILRGGENKIRFPHSELNVEVMNEMATILSSLIQDPKSDRNALINKAADTINQDIELLQLRGK